MQPAATLYNASARFSNNACSPGDKKFGILNLEVNKLETFKPKRQHFILNIDRSGSMASLERDGMSKMQHVTHTIKNMLRYFAHDLKSTDIYVSVITFDNRVDCIIEKTLISNDNLNELINIVDGIYARDMTNISAAIAAANKLKNSFTEEIDHTHILLTDGIPTCGMMSHGQLRECLDVSYRNIMIGYGIDHNMQMLQHMANYNKGEYYFVESAENAGNVYGEILHNILYEIMTDMVITIENAEIYNWQTNVWVSELTVGTLSAGVEKVFHIQYEMPNHDEHKIICLNLNYTKDMIEWHDVIPTLGPDSGNSEDNFDVEKYTYRQKTLEVLFRAKNKKSNFADIEKEIKELMDEITKVMKTREDLNDTASPNYIFMQNLRDDLHVAKRSLHSRYGELFLSARRLSQGNQRAYNIKDLDGMDSTGAYPEIGSVAPFGSAFGSAFRSCPAGPAYQMSDAQASPYACDGHVRLMRECSQPIANPVDHNSEEE
jgi:uncharacterized protein YegL